MSWSYDSQDEWAGLAGCQAGGRRQSPINIPVDGTVQVNDGGLLLSGNYTNMIGKWTNNGRSLQFELSDTLDVPSFSWKDKTYQLKQFHFHWGSRKGQGSEHTINNQPMDAELHLVFGKTHGSTTDGDHLAVLGVLLATRDNYTTNTWEQLGIIPQYGQSLALKPIDIDGLLPVNKSYWHYEGSLTTPPCSEVVQWFVFNEVMGIPAGVISKWRQMPKDTAGSCLTCNYRRVQSINNRTISLYKC
jgi:carbonic anhydrase